MSCSKNSNLSAFMEVVKSKRIAKKLENQIPFISETKILFPDSESHIGRGRGGKWQAIAFAVIYKRYVLIIAAPLTVDEANATVTNIGPAEYQFYENVVSSQNMIDGKEIIDLCDANKIVRLNAETWSALVKARGDFRSIGICLLTNSPLAIPNSMIRPF